MSTRHDEKTGKQCQRIGHVWDPVRAYCRICGRTQFKRPSKKTSRRYVFNSLIQRVNKRDLVKPLRPLVWRHGIDRVHNAVLGRKDYLKLKRAGWL